MHLHAKVRVLSVTVLALMAASALSAATIVRVTVENLAPQNGTYLTPVWVGFHDGNFDVYNTGSPATEALERLAEDGMTDPLSMMFLASGNGTVDGTLGGGPIAPGASVSGLFTLDELSPMSQYFSFASMVVPSNDAFIGNDNPMAWQVFNLSGTFTGFTTIIMGSMVMDAGTEQNDEVPMNTAFFGQTMPNTGMTEGGTVMIHPGFLPPAAGAILADPMFANADFKAPGYQVARITVEAVPEPGSIILLGAGLGALLLVRRRFS